MTRQHGWLNSVIWIAPVTGEQFVCPSSHLVGLAGLAGWAGLAGGGGGGGGGRPLPPRFPVLRARGRQLNFNEQMLLR